MIWYLDWVTQYPLASAFIQFATLGMGGEIVSHVAKTKSLRPPCSWWQSAGKIAAWGVLGLVIKFGFTGMRGFVNALAEHELLPAFFTTAIGWAIAMSVLTNILFGPQMMLFHRLEENLIMRQWNWNGLSKAWFTLIWFWIPAHTLTFSLPREFQIGLAAVWSVALGVIMGLTAPRKWEIGN